MAAISALEAPRLPPRVRLWPSAPCVKEQGGSSAPAALSTKPRDQVGSFQRWARGTLAATPKIIPCPGSPATAEPASSLSTSPTLSDSDEPTERSRARQGHTTRRLFDWNGTSSVCFQSLCFSQMPDALNAPVTTSFVTDMFQIFGYLQTLVPYVILGKKNKNRVGLFSQKV